MSLKLQEYHDLYFSLKPYPGEHHFTATYLLPRLTPHFPNARLLYLNPDGMKNFGNDGTDLERLPILGDLVWGHSAQPEGNSKPRIEVTDQIEVKMKNNGGCAFSNFTHAQAVGLTCGEDKPFSREYSSLVYVLANRTGVLALSAAELRSVAFAQWKRLPSAANADQKYWSINLHEFFPAKNGAAPQREGSFFAWQASDADQALTATILRKLAKNSSRSISAAS